MPAFSQVSNDNEDEVYKIDARTGMNDFVPGQVLVKFKDESPVNVSRTRGIFRSAGNSTVDAVLKEFGVEAMDKLLPNAKPLQTRRKTRAFNGEMIEEKDLSQIYLVKTKSLRKDSTMQLVNKLKEIGEVEYAEPNYKVYIMGQVPSSPASQKYSQQRVRTRAYTTETTNDVICADPSGNPLYNEQWGIKYEGLPELWKKPIINKKRPVIAILDTGVDITHPDLVDNIWTKPGTDDEHGYDFINNTTEIRDYSSHGTHVAGIAAASNNDIGIVGANPQALIMSVTVMQSDGIGDIATIIKGVDYATENDADIINLSLGTYANSKAFRDALEKAYTRAVIVGSAGNDAIGIYPECGCSVYKPLFPAAYYFVLGVQASTPQGNLAGFSNFDCDGPIYSCALKDVWNKDNTGVNYELLAPGVEILSSIPGGTYISYNGTSMAAPLISGAISSLMMVKEYDNQELIWADLIHSENFAQAYEISNRPAELDLIRIIFGEGKELSEFPEEDPYIVSVDAGQIIDLYPVIRTTFGKASNIKMSLAIGEYENPDLVNFQKESADFGFNLDAYGKGVSANPLTVEVANNVANGRHIKLKLTAICDESSTPLQQEFVLVVNNLVKIGGIIKENTSLTPDHIYYVTDNLAVPEGVILTIEPGTRLEFDEGMGLTSFGKLEANGTPGKPIIFTRHIDGGSWAGIKSHESSGVKSYSPEGVLYTNSDSTLFTLLPTEQTPNLFERPIEHFYTREDEQVREFYLADYIGIDRYLSYGLDMNPRKGDLTNPEFLTSAVLQLLSDWNDYCDKHQQSDENTHFWMHWPYFLRWSTFDNPRDTISYCVIEGIDGYNHNYYPYMKDCVITAADGSRCDHIFEHMAGIRNNITSLNSTVYFYSNGWPCDLTHSNIINNYFGDFGAEYLPRYSLLKECNYFNNSALLGFDDSKYAGKEYKLCIRTSSIEIDKSNLPAYLGTSREDLVRPYVFEIGNAPNTYGTIDLSNMRKTPVPEAHGVVWKVVVDGYDAQDEYDQMPPLGVGKHKFEVYFNRKMNKQKVPQVYFGIRDPYTQNAVMDDGSWNEEGTKYTVYTTITGKIQSDGVNRIYVYGAEDDEFFECPYEKDRFNINIQSASSLRSGFTGEAGLGCVELDWSNAKSDEEDILGYNIYRYTAAPEDSIRVNDVPVNSDEKHYTDYDITPGITYYYKYKLQSTDLKEYQPSNVVAVTPLTAKLGDVTGNNEVDVFDIVYEVNYILGQKPKAFVKCAADVNSDNVIDVLDVQGIIKTILDPSAASRTRSEEASPSAVYTIQDGVLYVESPVVLGGVQVQVNVPEKTEITTFDDLKGFEQAGSWLSKNDYRFLAYNMKGKTLAAGKHALLRIGDGQVTSIRLGDANAKSITVIAGEGTTAIDNMATAVKKQSGIYNLKGQKVAGSAEEFRNLPKGIYIIDGNKVLK